MSEIRSIIYTDAHILKYCRSHQNLFLMVVCSTTGISWQKPSYFKIFWKWHLRPYLLPIFKYAFKNCKSVWTFSKMWVIIITQLFTVKIKKKCFCQFYFDHQWIKNTRAIVIEFDKGMLIQIRSLVTRDFDSRQLDDIPKYFRPKITFQRTISSIDFKFSISPVNIEQFRNI